MYLPSNFQERLHQMEQTRNQRLSLLQAEKELQSQKSHLLSTKLSSLRHAERRCLLLEKRKAELGAEILAKKFEIGRLDADYDSTAEKYRALRGEIGEVERKKKEKDAFYEMKISEMAEFEDRVRRCLDESRSEVQSLRASVLELHSTLKELQDHDGYLNSSEIVEAEKRKMELLAMKDNLDKILASNNQLRSLLQKRLDKVLISGDMEGKEAELRQVKQ